jgi:hypothetical protein
LIIVAVKIRRQNQDNLRHMKYRNNFLVFTPPFKFDTKSYADLQLQVLESYKVT